MSISPLFNLSERIPQALSTANRFINNNKALTASVAILAIAVWKSVDTINKARKNPQLNLDDLNFYSKFPLVGDEFKLRYAKKLESFGLALQRGEDAKDALCRRNMKLEALFRELADKGNQEAKRKAKYYKGLVDQHLKESS